MRSLDKSLEDAFETLADEFTRRLRAGDSPDIEEIARANPELQDRILNLFPMLRLMEMGDQPPPPAAAPERLTVDVDLKRIGDFRIVGELGRGGMGVVYEAVQESLNRRVALKLLPRSNLDSRSRERFQQESRVAAMLHHSSIVPVYGVGEQDDYTYFAMQFIEGESLDVVLQQLRTMQAGSPKEVAPAAEASYSPSGVTGSTKADPSAESGVGTEPSSPTTAHSAAVETATMRRGSTKSGLKWIQLSDSKLLEPRTEYWKNVAQLGKQVCDGLAHAHAMGILHRDIKPSNIILDESGTAWITDFGLAKLTNNANLTRTGEVVGTLRYLPPEHLSGQADPRSDLFGLGLTLYELATLQPAFDHPDQRRLMALVLECQPIAPRKLEPRIPRDLETIILKSIAAEPDRRYRSAQEMSGDLQRFLDGQPIQARPISPPERLIKWARRRPAVAALTFAFCVLAVVAFAGITWKWREADANFRESVVQANAREQYFSAALEAVDTMLTRVGSDRLANVPGLSQIRRELLDDALAFYTEFLQESGEDPKLQAEIGRVHRRVGDIYSLLGNLEAADDSYGESYAVFSRLNRQYPENLSYLRDRGAALSSRGSCRQQIGRSEESEDDLREAILLMQEGLRRSNENAGVAPTGQWLAELGNAHYLLGVTLLKTEGNPLAIESFEKSVDFFEQVPRESRTDSIRKLQASCLNSFASINDSTMELERSFRLRRQAADILEELIERHPDSPDYRSSLANCRQDLFGVEARRGKMKEAVAELESVVSLRNTLVSEFPGVPSFKSELVRSYAVLGGMLDEMGEKARALEILSQAEEVADDLLSRWPENTSYRSDHAYLMSIISTRALTNARADQPDEAIASCEKSMAAHEYLVDLNPQDLNARIEFAKANRNLAFAYSRAPDRRSDAEERFQSTLTELQDLAEANESNIETLYQLAYTQISFSNWVVNTDEERAMELISGAIRSYLKLTELQPAEPRHRLQLTRAYDQLANLQFRSGQQDAWEQTLRIAADNMQAVVEKFGMDVRLGTYWSISLNRLAHCLKTRGQVDEAATLFEKTRAHREQEYLANPRNETARREWGSSCRNLAWIHSLFANEPNYRLAQEFAEKAVELNPDTSNGWLALAYSHLNQQQWDAAREALSHTEDDDQAVEMVRRALLAQIAWEQGEQKNWERLATEAIAIRNSGAVANDMRLRWMEPEFFRIVEQVETALGETD